jgi:hypothetical protein
MLCREIFAVCSEIHTKHINTLYRQRVELIRATISFVMSVRPPARNEQLGSKGADFHEVGYSSNFRKSVTRKFKFH